MGEQQNLPGHAEAGSLDVLLSTPDPTRSGDSTTSLIQPQEDVPIGTFFRSTP